MTPSRTASGPRPSAPERDPRATALFDERYRAMSSRDRRFDGQFFTGVHSTGIYCRPSCPATTPQRRNVSFYLTQAAAHEAGLRACKRCLPDAVPGSPEWDLRDDTAARAMRLIADGVVEREGVVGLAARLGYTTRHLSRLLGEELGAGPLALARAQRAQTARTLLVSTPLPISDVAFAAGFSSVRQFNATIAEVYERTPTELRALAGGRGGGAASVGRSSAQVADAPAAPGSGGVSGSAASSTAISLRLPARAPFDGAGVLSFLAARAVAGVEHVDEDPDAPGALRYARSLALPGGPAVVSLRVGGTDAAPELLCDARVSTVADLPPLVARVRRLVDLDADAEAIDAVLSADPRLAPLVAANPGIRVPGAVDPGEILLRALLGQQISVAAARTALARLTAALGDELPPALVGPTEDATVRRLLPTPAAIAERGGAVLRGPRQRIDTILRVCDALASGELDLGAGRSREEIVEQLISIRGIGPWTAGYVSMRVSGSPDVLLTGDLVLRQGAEALGLPVGERALAAEARRWAPWRSYAGMHLWRAAAARPR